MKYYFIAENDKQSGPLTIEDLRGKQIDKDTLVWSEGMPEWVAAETVEELRELLTSKPPVLPAPAVNINPRCVICGREYSPGVHFCSYDGGQVIAGGHNYSGYYNPHAPMAGGHYQQAYVQQPKEKSNAICRAGFVLALLGLILCWFPIANVILWLLGLIFSFVGVFKEPRGLAVAGLILTLAAILVLVMIWSVMASIFYELFGGGGGYYGW